LIILLQWAIVFGVVDNSSWSPVLKTSRLQGVPLIGMHVFPLLAVTVIVITLKEMLCYSADGEGSQRIAYTLFTLLYLGLPPLVLMKIQRMPNFDGTLALAATVFVPKLGDVGAFFTGTFLGNHKMAPRLSPKKTWRASLAGWQWRC